VAGQRILTEEEAWRQFARSLLPRAEDEPKRTSPRDLIERGQKTSMRFASQKISPRDPDKR